ncbi:MAG TPA: thioredoxin family protein [Burkholderiales bacterium]|nr:thioredoxin family protein [Burkholderiales bacterium]
MKLKSVLKLVLAGVSLAAAASAVAAPSRAYDAGAFKEAQSAGKSVLVEIHADWCGECRMQDKVLGKLSAEAPYAGLVRLRVDFDGQKDLVKSFGARKESTLILYKGDREVGRAVGITSEPKIRELLERAI